MAVPTKKVSRSRRGTRRSHSTLPATEISLDQVSGEIHLRHHITKTGFYMGKKRVNIN